MQELTGHGYIDNKQHSQAGTHTATGVHDNNDCDDIHTGLQNDLGVQSRPAIVDAEHEDQAGQQITAGCPDKQLRLKVLLADELLGPAVQVQYQKQQRQEAAIIIK